MQFLTKGGGAIPTKISDEQWMDWLGEIEKAESEKEGNSVLSHIPTCPTCVSPFTEQPRMIALIVDGDLHPVPICQSCRDAPNAIKNGQLVTDGIIGPDRIFECFETVGYSA